MSYAILHIPSGILYVDELWEYYPHMSRTHAEYFVHSFNHSMVPMNQLARNFKTFCETNKISPGLDTEFEIIENYEIKVVDDITKEE